MGPSEEIPQGRFRLDCLHSSLYKSSYPTRVFFYPDRLESRTQMVGGKESKLQHAWEPPCKFERRPLRNHADAIRSMYCECGCASILQEARKARTIRAARRMTVRFQA